MSDLETRIAADPWYLADDDADLRWAAKCRGPYCQRTVIGDDLADVERLMRSAEDCLHCANGNYDIGTIDMNNERRIAATACRSERIARYPELETLL